jgi:hypothetical protein
MNNKPSLSQAVTLVGLLLLLVSCTQISQPTTSATPTIDSAHLTAFAQEQSTPAPSPSPTPTPLVANAANVGPVPQTCPPGPTPKDVNPSLFGPGVGGSPVWAIGFDGPHATVHLNGWSEDPSLVQYGWNYKILWEIGPHYTHSVMLRGGSLRNGTLLWFQFGDQAPTMTPVLDSQHPGTITGFDAGWAGFPSYLLIPGAGCYYLEAHWPGGSWRISFAAGL